MDCTTCTALQAKTNSEVPISNDKLKELTHPPVSKPGTGDVDNPIFLLFERYECNRIGDNVGEALSDALKIISLDDKNVVAYRDALDCYIRLGDVFEADEIIARAKKFHEEEIFCDVQVRRLEKLKSLREDISDSLTGISIKRCLQACNTSLRIAPDSDDIKFIKMRCLVILKRFSDAEHMSEIICNDSLVNVMCCDALKLYYASYVDESLEILRSILASSEKNIKAVEDVKHKILRYKDLFQAGESFTTFS